MSAGEGERETGRPARRGDEPDGAEVSAELASHLEGTVDLLVSRGWNADEARSEALRRFGDFEAYRARLERMARRRRRRDALRNVVRTCGSALAAAVRNVGRAPGLSAAVIVTLALGIGANTAVFRVADRLLLSPPEHVAGPAEVVRLHQTLLTEGEPLTMSAFTYADVQDLRAGPLPARFGAVVAGMPETLGEGASAARVRVARADSAFLPLVGVTPALGRRFTLDDHRADAVPVALVAHRLWASRFGSDPGVVGRTIRLGTASYQIVGVLPAGFVGAEPPAIDVWLPLEASADDLWGDDWATSAGVVGFRVLARAASPEAVGMLGESATSVLRQSRGADYFLRGELLGVGTSSLIPGDGPEPGPIVRIARWLVGLALLVLLVACANVANLFLAQGERMRRETALRLALGAARSRIAAELLARTLVLALAGAAAALLVTAWGGRLLDDLFLSGMELGARPQGDRLIVFVAGAAVAAAVLSGLVPAALAARGGLRASLEGEGRATMGAGRLRWALVTVQTTLSALLLVGALLFVLSLRAAVGVEWGFDHERLLMVRIEADPAVDPPGLYEEAERSLTGSPGVASVASTVAVPFVLLYGLGARLPGSEPPAGLTVNAVGGGFLSTMGVPLVRGREIERSDLQDGAEPVAVVDRSAAARLWPGEDALGQCLIVGREGETCARVVGVAESHAGTSFNLPGDPRAQAPLMAWVPLTVAGRSSPAALMVRTRGAARDAAEAVHARVTGLPGVRFAEIEAMSAVVGQQTHTWRLGAFVLSLFGAIALGVAVVGLYGVLAFDVARRRREIGIRMALGARAGRVVARVVRAALVAVVGGIALALPPAVWGARRLGSLLYEVSPGDPLVFATAAGILLATAALAALLPAWRASRVDPRESLAEI